MGHKSFLDCPHLNVQSFTEYCLDCGYNRYMTYEEYYKNLKARADKKLKGELIEKIRKLENELGFDQ